MRPAVLLSLLALVLLSGSALAQPGPGGNRNDNDNGRFGRNDRDGAQVERTGGQVERNNNVGRNFGGLDLSDFGDDDDEGMGEFRFPDINLESIMGGMSWFTGSAEAKTAEANTILSYCNGNDSKKTVANVPNFEGTNPEPTCRNPLTFDCPHDSPKGTCAAPALCQHVGDACKIACITDTCNACKAHCLCKDHCDCDGKAGGGKCIKPSSKHWQLKQEKEKKECEDKCEKRKKKECDKEKGKDKDRCEKEEHEEDRKCKEECKPKPEPEKCDEADLECRARKSDLGVCSQPARQQNKYCIPDSPCELFQCDEGEYCSAASNVCIPEGECFSGPDCNSDPASTNAAKGVCGHPWFEGVANKICVAGECDFQCLTKKNRKCSPWYYKWKKVHITPVLTNTIAVGEPHPNAGRATPFGRGAADEEPEEIELGRIRGRDL